MSFYGAARLLIVAWDRRREAAAPESLPDIPPGRFAAWAREREGDPLVPGTACRTADGRAGLLVEVVDGGETMLVCAPA